MDREQAKEYIQQRGKEYLQPDNSNKGFICPICGSGSGKKGTGITTKDGIHFTCWTGCFTNADIIDIIGLQYGLSDYNSKLKKACDIFGISLDSGKNTHTQERIHNSSYTITQQQESEKTDYTNFFLQANKDIGKTNYHRGLSLETLNRFKIGYVEHWKHPKAPNAPESPRLIIPTSKESYLARDTREKIPAGQEPYTKSKVGKIHLFNINALHTATKPIFIVEGELDALSVIDVGGEAIALGTTTKVKSFIELLKTTKPEQPLILALDNDKAGEKADKELAKGLKELKIPFYRLNVSGQYKDANEALRRNREAFKEIVAAAESIEDEATQAKKEEYLKNSVARHLQDFVDGISESADTPYIPTGFPQLDSVFDGGLYEGLYFVGAISSLGKTTLITQIADQIAQSGQDVLIFSLEMARTEIMAKSISRHTLQQVLSGGGNGDIRNAKTTRGITTNSRYKNYSETERRLIKDSITAYAEYAEHLFITEGVGDIGAEQVRQTVKDHINFTGNHPVVIIDYLQILAPYSEKATDKQNTDKSVLELKRISREYKIPIIGISSFNRTNYSVPVTMEAFKESGRILCHAA